MSFDILFSTRSPSPNMHTLSLHDALPISSSSRGEQIVTASAWARDSATFNLLRDKRKSRPRDRKSTRLNSSHLVISYAVVCLKKKNNSQHEICNLKYPEI